MGQILLIGKEIPYKPDNNNEELYCDIGARDRVIFLEGAKAQLKKVVDEGERLGVLNLTEEKGIALARTCLRMYNFWQALIKEAE